jgi:hypothetical protein
VAKNFALMRIFFSSRSKHTYQLRIPRFRLHTAIQIHQLSKYITSKIMIFVSC